MPGSLWTGDWTTLGNMTKPAEPRAPKRPQPRSGAFASQKVVVDARPPSLAPRANAPRPVRGAGRAKQQAPLASSTSPTKAERNTPRQRSPLTFKQLLASGSGRKRSADPQGRSSGGFGLKGLSLSVRLIAVVTVVAFLGLNLIPIGLQWYQQQREQRAIAAQIEQARGRNAELQDTLSAWEDPDYIATQARKRLGFAWPGEVQYTVVGVPEDEAGKDSGDPLARQGQERKPWPSMIMQSMVDADAPAASSSLADLIAGDESQ